MIICNLYNHVTYYLYVSVVKAVFLHSYKSNVFSPHVFLPDARNLSEEKSAPRFIELGKYVFLGYIKILHLAVVEFILETRIKEVYREVL